MTLFATGGTISGIADSRRHDHGQGGDAVAAMWATPVELRPVEFADVPSRAMTPELMRRLAAAIIQEISEGCNGVVVTHGTDTLEETAYALSLMVPHDVPIALTGSMRFPRTDGFDGGANLRGAVQVALDMRIAELGPVVVFGDEIHLARWVTKIHTTRPAAFASIGLGAVGTVAEDRVHLAVTTVPSDFLGLPESLEGRPVELVWTSAGSDGRLVDAAATYAHGIVVAATGGGHVPPPLASAIGRAIESGVQVVLTSRCGGGPLLDDTYSGEGSEQHLKSMGVVFADSLAPLKARLRLQVALGLGSSAPEAFT